jgi:hypothetical protein
MIYVNNKTCGHVQRALTVAEALALRHTNLTVRGTRASSGCGVGTTLACSISGIIVTSLNAAFDTLVSHDVQELQRALVALDVRDVDRHPIRVVRALHVGDGFGHWHLVVRDVIQEDHLGDLRCI